MIDWWFVCHQPRTERYQLWHPKAHIKSVVKEDRSAMAGQRAAYVGNESYVDEYIGQTLQKLIIAFREPSSMGLEPARFASSGTGTKRKRNSVAQHFWARTL
jgi:rhamnogalacturonyl hydrolase YesR